MALQKERCWGWEARWEGVDGWRFKSCRACGGKEAGERGGRISLQSPAIKGASHISIATRESLYTVPGAPGSGRTDGRGVQGRGGNWREGKFTRWKPLTLDNSLSFKPC